MNTTVETYQIKPLVEQEMALKVYLDSLLFDDPPGAVSVEDVAVTDVVEIVVSADVQEQVVTDVAPEVVVSSQEKAPEPEQDIKQVSWADGIFESLKFKVAGFLTLAVPLVRLNGIIEWSDKLTPMPGYSEWFLGVLPNRGTQVKVIDIAKFVIPQNHKAREALETERKFRHILLIDEGRIGLACDGLGDVLKLTREQVRWRKDTSTRPWLAGTVIEEMCALIDIDHFSVMLKDGPQPDDIIE